VEYLHWRMLVRCLTIVEESQITDDNPYRKALEPLDLQVSECSDPEAVTKFVVISWHAEATGIEKITRDFLKGYRERGMIISTISTKGRSWHIGWLGGPLYHYYSMSSHERRGGQLKGKKAKHPGTHQ